MQLYRFSPIESKEKLFEAIKHIHFSSHQLCFDAFGKYLQNAGNMGVFCHYEEEYKFLTELRKELTEPSDNPDQKYYQLHQPITIPEQDGIPETTYTYLYIRKPDPYRHHVGDIDFYLAPEEYAELKQRISNGEQIKGSRIFPRTDLDMIELFNPDVDVLAYVSTKLMTEKVKIKQNPLS